jgi:hypothetical protein
MDIDRTVGYGLALGLLLSVGACAKGSDLKGGAEATGDDGGSTASVGAGGKKTAGSGGRAVAEAGGGSSVSKGGGGGVSGGVGQGGAIILSRGGGPQGLGGTQSNGGATTAGAAGTSDVGAPVDGLGVHQVDTAPKDGAYPLNLKLENKSGATVNLSKVTIRYYFTIDDWTKPVAVVYYAGANGVTADEPVVAEMDVQDGADHYVEIAFTAGSLANNGVLEFQGELHDNDYSTDFDPTNDFSYTGLEGYNDHITVYVSGALSWGIEPGTQEGTGGAGGEAGAAGAESGGAAGSAGAGEAGVAAGEGGAGGEGGASSEAGASSTDGGASTTDGGTSSVDGGGSAGASGVGDAGTTSSAGGADASAGSDGLGGDTPTDAGASSVGGGDVGGATGNG